jgi:hypothetical protein
MPLSTITQLEPFNINASATFSFASTSVTANVSAGNILTNNLLYANGVAWSFGGGSSYSNANVAAYLPTYTGQMANALVAGTVYTADQPNITSLGTLTSLTASGLITATAGGIKVGNLQDPSGTNTIQLLNSNVSVTGNIVAGSGGSGNVTATYFIGNGSQLTGLPASYSNTNVAAYLPTYTGNVSANYFIGNGSTLTNITGANVSGYVPLSTAANTAGTVTVASQPNITSIGNLVNANVDGNLLVTGNLTVNGTTQYTNVNNLYVKDPIIEMGGGTNNAPLTNNDGKDRGTLLHYYTTTPVDAFMGWDNSNGEFAFGSNVTVTSEVATFNTFGNVRAGNFIGTLSGAATTAGTVTTNAQPNITSVGTLASLSVSGNLSVGNVITSGTGGNISDANWIIANYFSGNGSGLSSITGGNVSGQVANSLIAGTVYTAAQPNITSTGTLSSLSVTGNISSAGNVIGTHYGNGYNLSGLLGSNVLGQVSNALVAGTVYTAAQPNITSVGTLSSVTVSGLTTATGGLKTGNIQDTAGTNTISVSSATVGVIGNLTVGTGGSGNLTATYVIGNGSALTSITGGNVTGQVGNALVAGTVYTNAQPNITSVGTLASLSVTGNITAGNINGGNAIVANYFVGDGSLLTGLPASYSNTNVAAYLPTYTGNFSPSNLVVSTSANLGAVGNVIITGGTANYVLSTDGAGTLSWVAQTGGGGGGGGTGLAIGSVEVFTADGSANTYTLTTTPSNEDQITVNIDGVLQLHSSFSLAGNVVTLAGTPVTGAKVEITNFNSGGAAGSNTQIQFNDSGNIAGSAALTFDKTSNTLNATNITANGTPVATTGKAIAMSIVFGG